MADNEQDLLDKIKSIKADIEIMDKHRLAINQLCADYGITRPHLNFIIDDLYMKLNKLRAKLCLIRDE